MTVAELLRRLTELHKQGYKEARVVLDVEFAIHSLQNIYIVGEHLIIISDGSGDEGKEDK